jgi:ABC-type branched-subunit amino acid transport system substrate-binding protein
MGARLRFLAVVLAAVTVAGACGSRLPDQTLKTIDADLTGGIRAAANTGLVAGPGDTGGAAVAEAPTGPTTTAVPGATTATTAGPAGGPVTPVATACRPGAATSPGVTPREIKVASIVTDSGPLPGATEGSYRGAAAYFAMVNSQGGVCGRKLTLVKGDDGLDPARARGEFLRLEPQVLGFVGSYAVADSGYVDLIGKTKVPFVGLTIDPSGRKLPTVFPKTRDDLINTGPFAWWKQQHPDVTKAAILYADVGGVKANIDGTAKAVVKAGFQLVEPPIAVGVADPDYTGVVRRLQDKGVEFVYLFAFEVNMHVRFNRNMRQQHYEPKIKGSNVAFNDRFSQLLKTDGDGWENLLLYLPFLDPAEKGRSKPVADFLNWNHRVFPGQQLDLFNVAGWGRAAMFVQALRNAGGDVSRASLLAGLATVPTYDDGGLGVKIAQPSGGIDRCFVMARHVGGTWKRSFPTGVGYECGLGEILKFK